MNRAARRAFVAIQRAPAPAYGRPADLLRQLAALGVAVRVVRSPGFVRLDFRIAVDRIPELRAVQAVFPSNPEWDAECVATLLVVAGLPIDGLPLEPNPPVDLATLLAAPPRDALARRLLARGARH